MHAAWPHLITALVFSAAGAFALAALLVWPFYAAWVTATSLVLVLQYGLDKWQARRDGARIPELALHLMAAGGGWPGGWIGRELFRHKTRKRSFALILCLSAVVHLGAAYLMFLR